jgi:general secretion pathway protein H
VSVRERGFTLIEILVVLVIVAIITGAAILSLNILGGAPPAKHAAEQLSALAELASQQAVMEGQQYGLLIERHSYRFFIYDGAQWQPVQDSTLFHPRTLGKDVNLDLQLEGTKIKLAVTPDASGDTSADDESGTSDNDSSAQPKPQIALLSSGEVTPFKITVSDTVDPSQQYIITGSLMKGIVLEAPEDKHAP